MHVRPAFDPATPTVVRGAAMSWLVHAPWTASWFSSMSGGSTIKVRAFFDGETIPTCGFETDLATYVAYLRTGDASAMRASVAPLVGAQGRDLDSAVFNCGSIPVGDLDPRCADGIDLGVFPYLGQTPPDEVIAHYWLTTTGGAIGLHRDGYFGWLVQLVGRKEITLLAPDQRRYLYLSDWNAIYSPVDVYDEVYVRHPRFRHATWQRWVIEPGDAVFIPKLWFHNLRALDPDTTSVNVWFADDEVFIDGG
jgi:hypothetical protein